MSNRAILFVAVSSDEQAKSDKTSLPEQLKRTRAAAEQLEATVIDELIVDGFSRSYWSVELLQEAMRDAGLDAIDRLKAHWKARDFDWLIVDDSTRLARKGSLMKQIMGQTIEAGARIWMVEGEEVNANNVNIISTLSGFMAQSHVDQHRRKLEVARKGRAARGLNVFRLPISHSVVRDERGKSVGVIVNEDKRPLFEDYAKLLLDGVAVMQIEPALHREFGHVRDDGTPFQPPQLWRIVNSPHFWGHAAFRWYPYRFQGMVCIEPGEPVPDDMHIHYDAHEPMFTGALAQQVKAEIRRRREMRGSVSPSQTHRFSGLLVCGGCGYRLRVYSDHGTVVGMRCFSKYRGERECTQEAFVTEASLVEQISAVLTRAIESGTYDLQLSPPDTAPQDTERIEQALRETERQLRNLIRQQAVAAAETAPVYQAEIDSLGKRKRALETELVQHQARSANQQQLAEQRRLALDDVAALSIPAFWQQSSRVINQTLHRILGGRVFVAEGDAITHLAKPRPRGRKRKRS